MIFMFLNNTNCDVYIGTGAGKKLMQDIENAKYSVKILSPFLSPFLVRKLIDLHYNNVNVQLITTDTIEDFYGDRKRNIHELIHQHIHIDREAEALRNRWKKIKQLVNWSMIFFIALLGWFALEFKNIRTLGVLIPIVLLFLTGQFLKSRIKGKRVFSYSYEQLFPFKVVVSPESSGFNELYLHGKIYIIDDKIAYLGSLNFTHNGTKNNYETRIRLSDTESVQKIIEEFDRLLYNEELPDICIQSWGKLLYQETIN
jgi:phosphatidylserine/phosphatidylglycerophosphate/cardiolipin synthase-like enzyme